MYEGEVYDVDLVVVNVFFFQAVDGIRDLVRSRGLGDVYKRQGVHISGSGCGEVDLDPITDAIESSPRPPHVEAILFECKLRGLTGTMVTIVPKGEGV